MQRDLLISKLSVTRFRLFRLFRQIISIISYFIFHFILLILDSKIIRSICRHCVHDNHLLWSKIIQFCTGAVQFEINITNYKQWIFTMNEAG